ncbi:Uma2 family endonuclease [Clostridium hydrogenum]|uniref:Uma2 family endonuclease n=1 Tax=Clostridium hydrogenum TaxID=2855764 RepID=UPI002E349138|nr:Uma2 family endonuclease [Clostridium hydrogenum]
MGGALKKNKKYTYGEFLKITNNMERAEFIDGEIILQATPTLLHQNIIGNLLFEFKKYFNNKTCKAFIAPFDIILQKDDEEIKRVQPDLFVLCGEIDVTKNEFTGIPSLVVEVVSPSNASDDYIKKLNLYMKFGVKEYWIVSPKNKNVHVFVFNEETEVYNEPIIYYKEDIVKSSLFEGLSMDIKSIFD